MRRGRRLALLAAVGALVGVTVATASGSAVPVVLRLDGATHRDVGQAVRLTATAKLPAGTHLLIQRFVSGRAPAKVAECLRSPCVGSFHSATAGVAAFQAFAIRRTGERTTVLGRSKRLTITWAVVVPTPPPPAATPGHYEGTTVQNEIFDFDVTADGRSLTNLRTGQINEHCDTTPQINLSGGNLTAPGPFPIAADGSFTIKGTYSSYVNGAPSSNTLLIVGRISGETASGTYKVDTFYSVDGDGRSCTSDTQTWTATKTG
jgi:hypothetical protein